MTDLLALKLGSSNTSIYKNGEGLVLVEPTLVAYMGVGKAREIKAIGTKAKKMLGRTSETTFVSSPIFEGRVIDTDLAVEMLKEYLLKIYPKKLFRPRLKALICVPLGLTLSEKKAFEKVCYLAGIQDVIVVPSIICGAIGYDLPTHLANGSFLVNIGGGSTDIAVISMNNIVNGINIGIGGEIMDTAIQKIVLDKYNLIIAKDNAEKIKEEIGSLYPNDMSNTEIIGIDQSTKLSRDDVASSSDVYEAIEHYYSLIVDAIKSVINNCPPNIVEDIASEGIYVFGGASQITGAEQYFRKKLNLNVRVEDQTSAVDVIGAGKLLSDSKLLFQVKDLI